MIPVAVWRFAACLMALCSLSLAQPAKAPDLGPKILEAQWVSADRLSADPQSVIPSPWGNDAIRDGEIEVRAKGFVKVDLEGVPQEAEYTLWVCKLSYVGVSERCAELGKVAADAKGRADAILPWPGAATGPQAVFFVLRRSGATMFVSGFDMPAGLPPGTGIPPAPPKPDWKQLELKGTIDAVGTNSFSLGGIVILVNQDTRYGGRVNAFADLSAGMNAEVNGIATAGGILAARISVSGKN